MAASPPSPAPDWTASPLVTGGTTVRVRYEETDRAGVGYHANTFVWFECARTELLRGLGFPYRELEESGWLLTVAAVTARYHRSVLYDEELAVECAILRAEGARLEIEYRIIGPDGSLRTTGSTTLGCLDPATGRPRRLPAPLVECLRSGSGPPAEEQ
ncbi:MAG: acyl-CoA thioesterase [Planctomycetota bacterium]